MKTQSSSPNSESAQGKTEWRFQQAGIKPGAAISFVDITARKRAQEELDRFFTVSLDLLTVAGLDGYFKRVNPAWEKTLGWTEKELLAKPFLEFVHPDDRETTAAEAAALATGRETISFENRYQCKDGTYKWLTWSAAADLDKQLIFSAARNITERKEREKALAQAKEEAERANRSKSEFLSRMSHELRTPLNAILGFGQLLELENLNQDQQESVRHIVSAGRHLLDLINEVLDISRIEVGRMAISLEPVSVSDVLRDVVTLAGPLARDHNVQLFSSVEDADLFVTADRQRLKQVLLNLLSNAIKYNRSGGEVRLATHTPANGRSGMVRIEVADTGAGIPADKIVQLFTPFQRLGAEKTKIDGTGLGLALSKHLVELMNGKIGVESTPDKGSTFWVELPQTENPLRQIESAPTVVDLIPGPASATVLYIEDNPSNLRLVERIIQRRPEIKLISADQGLAGLALAQTEKPDLILLDLHLPDIHGEEVLKKLRGDHATGQIPVIVISADATSGQIKRLKAAGAQSYLIKPIEVSRFLKVLDELLHTTRVEGPKI